MELELPKPIALTAVLVAMMLACGLIGQSVSPHTPEGRPVLLSPEVRTIEMYRRAATEWARDWSALAKSLHSILAGESDLFSLSQGAQQAFIRATELAIEAEAKDSPASQIGLREQVMSTATAFANASLAIARWVSAPSVENKSAAEQALATAEQSLATLEANEWIQSGQ